MSKIRQSILLRTVFNRIEVGKITFGLPTYWCSPLGRNGNSERVSKQFNGNHLSQGPPRVTVRARVLREGLQPPKRGVEGGSPSSGGGNN